MKKISKVAFTAALVGAMALVLVACGGSSSGSAASESAASSDATQDVYAMTKATFYEEDGTVKEVDTYERDEHGNTVQQTTQMHLGGNDTESVVKYETDENGYTVALTQPDGQEVTYEITLDGDKPLKSAGSNGAVTEYQYYDNGMVKEITSQFSDEYTGVISYDEDGYLKERASSFKNGNKANIAYTWEFDGSNNPASITVEEIEKSEDVSVGGLSAGKYTIECDADGNIVKVAKADSGDVVFEREYAKVDNPSACCRLNSTLKSV